MGSFFGNGGQVYISQHCLNGNSLGGHSTATVRDVAAQPLWQRPSNCLVGITCTQPRGDCPHPWQHRRPQDEPPAVGSPLPGRALGSEGDWLLPIPRGSICSWDAECQIAPAQSILRPLESFCPTLPAVCALEKYSDLFSFVFVNSFFPLQSWQTCAKC